LKPDFSNQPAEQPAAQATSALRASVRHAARRGVAKLLGLQRPHGDWEGEMVWCTMILAQVVIVRSLIGRPYDTAEKAAIIRHFQVSQGADGAFGMHPESPGYIFFTTLAYIALRLLGVDSEHPIPARALAWLHAQPEGVKAIPTWGKFWLCLLGLYPRQGLNAVPPELFLLPGWLPFHPSRFYCHTRLIYLGMAYLSGSRFQAPLPASILETLRRELYPEGFENIDFTRCRHRVAASDLYVPVSALLRAVYDLLGLYERRPFQALRRKALERCLVRIVQEQRSTRYQGISPVSGILNCLALFASDPQHPELGPSLEGVEAWRWEDEAEGLRYVGARSNSWDTAFAMQALCDAPPDSVEIAPALKRGGEFLAAAQQTEEIPDFADFWRDPARGGWCFSDGAHRWPVSDCAAEALSALLLSRDHAGGDLPLDATRLDEAVTFILSRQNADGGFGTYERRRGGRLLEVVNPSEMFGQCMTELSYIECTASSLTALAHYRTAYPDRADSRLGPAMERAIALLRKQQLPDGSYPGLWGINYTYAIFHVIKALRSAGVNADDPCLTAAAGWLLQKQRTDGGWGEHYTSCLLGHYVEHSESLAVMTSWALLALLEILPPDHPAIERGIAWLVRQQLADGGWPGKAVNGVFFGAAMLDYRLYPIYFPVWALNRYLSGQHSTVQADRAGHDAL
jgi:lanosterol synthase